MQHETDDRGLLKLKKNFYFSYKVLRQYLLNFDPQPADTDAQFSQLYLIKREDL